MANDFKRMWTKEEIKDTYYIKQQPEYETTYDISEEDFKKITSKNIVCFIDTANDKRYFYKILGYGENEHTYCFNSGNEVQILKVIYEEGNYYYFVRKEVILTPAEFENLVRETPTDVSIIEDQGKLELVLEHDGNVLAINDTPNQFLQRRLDKPSAEWYTTTSSEDFGTWLQDKLSNLYIGQVAAIEDGEYGERLYGIITHVSNENVNLKLLGVRPKNSGVLYELQFFFERSKIESLIIGSNIFEYSFNDVQRFMIF